MPARDTAAAMAPAPSCGAVSAESSPWKAPIGVRAPARMTMSVCMADSSLLNLLNSFEAILLAAQFAGRGFLPALLDQLIDQAHACGNILLDHGPNAPGDGLGRGNPQLILLQRQPDRVAFLHRQGFADMRRKV